MTSIEAAVDARVSALKLEMKCEATRKHGDIRPIGKYPTLDECFTVMEGQGRKPDRLVFWFNLASHTTRTIVRHLITPAVEPLYTMCRNAGPSARAWYFSFQRRDHGAVLGAFGVDTTLGVAMLRAIHECALRKAMTKSEFLHDYRLLCTQGAEVVHG